MREPLDTSPGLGRKACVQEVQPPWHAASLVDLHLPLGQVDAQVRIPSAEIEEVVLDDVAFVAERDDEILESVVGIDVHDVP